MAEFEMMGGCHCGAVRFRITAKPLKTYCCHCRICQRTSGAAFLAGAVVAAEDFAFTNVEPIEYQSSPRIVRLFCPTCHAQIGSRQPGETKLMDLHLSLFDNPTVIEPSYHMFTSTQISWLKLTDGLPRHAEGAPDMSELYERTVGELEG